MMTFLLTPLLLLSTALAEPSLTLGGQAPTFSVSDCDGKMVDLSATLARGPVVLAFYPKANTSGCTQEMAALVKNQAMFKRHHAQVLAVSADSAQALQAFRKQLQATFAFLPDTDGTLMKLYRCKMPVVTMAKRKTWVINQQGIIVHMIEGQDAIALKGVEQALEALTNTPR